MTQNHPQPPLDPLDQALATRLSRLAAMPVDTSRLETSLRAQLPPAPSPLTDAPVHRFAFTRHVRPLLAVAASLILIAALVIAFSLPSTVRAEPNQFVQLHEDLIAGKILATHAATIEQANALIAAQWTGLHDAPKLPSPPDAHLHACCLQPMQNKNVACVLLDYHSTPVTMSVARAADITSPPSCPPVTLNGLRYHIMSMGAHNMVMLERHGLWICLISSLPTNDLTTLASQLQF